MGRQCKVAALTVALIFSTSSGVSAEPASIPLGVGELYPSIGLNLHHNDNLLRGSTREINTFVSVLSPEVLYEIESNKSLILMEYGLEVGEHYSSHDDDYTDHSIRAEFEYKPTSRIFTALRGSFIDTRDPRGTGASEGGLTSNSEPDAYHTLGIVGQASYGAETAKGRFEVELGYKDKNYDNNRSTTFVRDRDDFFGSTRFYYRFMPKTRAVAEFRASNFNYENDAVGTPGLDSSTFKYLAGVTWEATFKTTGYAKIGLIDKQFDSDARTDSDAMLWEIGVDWQPRTYSTVSLSALRDFTETNGTGDFIEESSINADWKHYWRDHISTNINFTYAVDDYTTTREDDRISAGASVDYEMRRWLTLGAGYSYDERDSNTNIFDYDRNIFELTAVFSL